MWPQGTCSYFIPEIDTRSHLVTGGAGGPHSAAGQEGLTHGVAEHKTFCKENGLSWAGSATPPNWPTTVVSLPALPNPAGSWGCSCNRLPPSYEHMATEWIFHQHLPWFSQLSDPSLPVTPCGGFRSLCGQAMCLTDVGVPRT